MVVFLARARQTRVRVRCVNGHCQQRIGVPVSELVCSCYRHIYSDYTPATILNIPIVLQQGARNYYASWVSIDPNETGRGSYGREFPPRIKTSKCAKRSLSSLLLYLPVWEPQTNSRRLTCLSGRDCTQRVCNATISPRGPTTLARRNVLRHVHSPRPLGLESPQTPEHRNNNHMGGPDFPVKPFVAGCARVRERGQSRRIILFPRHPGVWKTSPSLPYFTFKKSGVGWTSSRALWPN